MSNLIAKYGVDYGCGDGGCVFKHRPEHFGGMSTNGGCHCLEFWKDDHEARRRARKGVYAMREYIKELQGK